MAFALFTWPKFLALPVFAIAQLLLQRNCTVVTFA
jgi:hypothetical protein